ncbi:hypothetical protein UY3_10964 [Chelonia mydas]|uniref:Uncharacterized protein n=1 Tax=Chelonia mydas TaxID=8469 RepID=M7B240_CHEMY|nr:hypothetical protein UY3_10964 [Chelonia mydas]
MKFKDRLAEDSRHEFTLMFEEGKLVARTALQDSLDGVDSAAPSMASAMSMRKCLWLKSSS